MNREPVAIANAVAALITAIAPLGQLFGWWELSADQLAGIIVAVGAIGTFAATLFSRNSVTPISDPRDNEGNPLT